MKSRSVNSWFGGTRALLIAPLFMASLLACGAADAEAAGPSTPVGYDQEPGPYAPTPGAPIAPEGLDPNAVNAADAEREPLPMAAMPPNQDAQGVEGEAEGDPNVSAPGAGDIAIGADPNAYSDTDPSALSDFRPALDPYGTWSDDPTYGTVWSPSQSAVGDDFAPYVSGGHWAYDDDYTWVSDYSWGWAPFHYGRWVYIGSGRGWSWIPGRSYAGAWVSWRYGGPGYGYVGWAPLPPTWYWRRGVAVGIGFVPPAPYVFCGTREMFSPGLRGRLVGGSQVAVIANHTRPFVGSGAVVAGHVSAHPAVAGPSPAMMNVPSGSVAHAAVTDRGIGRAQAFARPNTAMPLGGRAPAQTFRGNVYVGNGNVAYAGRTAYASPSVRGPYSANTAVATGPQYRGIAPTHYASPSYASPTYRAPQYGTPAYGGPRYAPSYSTPRTSAPVYASPRAPSYAAPRVSSPPAMSRPTFASPSVRGGGGGGGFRGGGGGGRGGRR